MPKLSLQEQQAKQDQLSKGIEQSAHKLLELRAYLRGYVAGGGVLDFQISGLEEALDLGYSALMDYRIRMTKCNPEE
jgi:hypothetical protein